MIREETPLESATRAFREAAVEYEQVARTHGEDPAPLDGAAERLAAGARAVLACGDEGQTRLLHLMQQGTLSERLWAAVNLHRERPKEALDAVSEVERQAPPGTLKATAFFYQFKWERRSPE